MNNDDELIVVDVIVPVHNGSLAHLRAAVESVEQQVGVRTRLRLLDDGSTDERIVAFLAERGAVRVAERGGVGAALNRLLAECTTSEFVARLDADDVAAPTRLAAQLAYLRAHPDVDVLGTNAVLFSERHKRRTTLPCRSPAVHFGLLFSCVLVHPSVMFRRRAALLDAMVYDASLHPHSEDFALWHALLRRGAKFANLAEPLLWLRKHAGSVSHRHAADQRRSAAALAPLAYDVALFASIDDVFAHRQAILDAAPLVCGWAGDKFSPDERREVAACADERAAELLALALQRFPRDATRIIQAMPPHLLATLLASMAAPRAPPATTVPWRASATIHVLLFSKDRAFQAQQCLRSFDECVVQPNAAAVDFSVTVLFCATSERTRAQYAALRGELAAWAQLVDERDEPCSALLQRLFAPSRASGFALFLVDDIVWYRGVRLDAVLARLGERRELFAVQLRLHAQVRRSVTAGVDCAPPASLETRDDGWCTWRTDAPDARAEWCYPFDLSGALYRASDVAAIVRGAALLGDEALTHPNRFENAGNEVLRRQLLSDVDARSLALACPAEPCMSIVTINRVQDVCANPLCGEPRSIEQLCELFDAGASLDAAQYRAHAPQFTTVHIGDWFTATGRAAP